MTKINERKHRAQRHAKAKLGKPYEEAVGELIRLLFPHAQVAVGAWVNGPDGRRELDVDIHEMIDGRLWHGIVECKDFNPKTTGPVGIGYVDALDSKQRDLHLDFAVICSNAGFTADAVRKASRLGIGLIGASRKADSRIRFRVVEEIYVRRVRIVEHFLQFVPAPGESPIPHLETTDYESICYQGRPVLRWLNSRLMLWLSVTPIVQGDYTDFYRLKEPVVVTWGTGAIKIQGLALRTRLVGAWFAQTVGLEADAGVYDHIRHRMRLVKGHRNLNISGFNPKGGNWISHPPADVWQPSPLIPGEVNFSVCVIENQPSRDGAALLDALVVPEDLIVNVQRHDDDARSVHGFG